MNHELTQRMTQHIAERTLKLLVSQRLLEPTHLKDPAFYAWPRRDRLVLVFDPLAAPHIDRVLSQKFTHRLSTALSGRRVIATNSRGIFLQVAYFPAPAVDLSPRPLDLSTQPGPLHVPLGSTARGALWLTLPELDAVLVGGARRMGKTRFLHGWIQALIHGGQAQLVLWDGKEGVEFGRYAGAENVTVINDVAEGLTQLTQAMAQRATLFKQANVPALPEYVRRSGEQLPPLVLILDEVAFLPVAAQPALADLVARGGAFGVHPILATQRPDAEAVKSLVKANLATRIALPVPAVQDSMVILGRPGAEKLAKTKGRLLLTWEGRLVEVQSFLIELPDGNSNEQSQPASLLTAAERRLAHASATQLAGWFKIRELATRTGESRDATAKIAKRWELQGFLTPVQRDARGHVLGRKMTPLLYRTAGLGGTADQAD